MEIEFQGFDEVCSLRKCLMLTHEVTKGKVSVCSLTFGKVDRIAKCRLHATTKCLPLTHYKIKAVRHSNLSFDERAGHDGPCVDHWIVRTTFVVQREFVKSTTAWLSSDVSVNVLGAMAF